MAELDKYTSYRLVEWAQMSHFFGIETRALTIRGLTTGDFATVKKKADFLNITNIEDISRMLHEEVKIKKSNVLQNSIGF